MVCTFKTPAFKQSRTLLAFFPFSLDKRKRFALCSDVNSIQSRRLFSKTVNKRESPESKKTSLFYLLHYFF